MADIQSMYITKLHLNRAARNLTADIQAMHRTIAWAAGDGRALWALPSRDVLIVQAPRPIRPTDLDGVVREAYSAQVPEVTGEVRMSLIANPTRMGNTDRKRTVVPMPDWAPWFERKLAGAATIDEIVTQDLGVRRGTKFGQRVSIHWAAFTATGTVTDPRAFRALVSAGIGHGKAYGCGLLLAVAR